MTTSTGAGKTRAMLLPPGYLAAVKADPNLDHEARVSILAGILVVREGGPLADQYRALTKSAPAGVDEALDLVELAVREGREGLRQYPAEMLRHAAAVIREHDDYSDRLDAFLQGTVAWPAAEEMLKEA